MWIAMLPLATDGFPKNQSPKASSSCLMIGLGRLHNVGNNRSDPLKKANFEAQRLYPPWGQKKKQHVPADKAGCP